jgi:hypothetical protein
MDEKIIPALEGLLAKGIKVDAEILFDIIEFVALISRGNEQFKRIRHSLIVRFGEQEGEQIVVKPERLEEFRVEMTKVIEMDIGGLPEIQIPRAAFNGCDFSGAEMAFFMGLGIVAARKAPAIVPEVIT